MRFFKKPLCPLRHGKVRKRQVRRPAKIQCKLKDSTFGIKVALAMRNTFLYLFLSLSGFLHAQGLDSIQNLKPVSLWSKTIKDHSDGYTQKVLSDSLLERSNASFTSLLENNSLIYFKENGLGMVSSPSFRGTNASQTAVLWNGIPINSTLNGQTDFNTVLTGSLDQLTIRSGSGSVPFGSGAIGGSILLDNAPKFDRRNTHQLRLGYGSYSTLNGLLRSTFSSKNAYIDVSLEGIQSDNDFKYLNSSKRNDDAAYYHYSLGLSAGWRKDNHRIFFHSNWYEGKRDFSGTLYAPARDGYRDYNTRNLLEWEMYFGDWTSSLKVAHLQEKSKYYANKHGSNYTQAKANTIWTDYNISYRLNADMRITGILQYNNVKGEGDNLTDATRDTGAAVLLFKHSLSQKWTYGLQLRQEFFNGFTNPFLFAFDSKYQFTSSYSLYFNLAKNYRVPTFNDLYWKSGGNENINPEKSIQLELGNSWHKENYGISMAGYYIKSTDMIKWIPRGALWHPTNISEAINYGLEVEAYFAHSWNQHRLRLEFAYAYTKAEDQELKKQLIYVPYHKYTGSLTYRYKSWNASYQMLFNGHMYTSSDNLHKQKQYDTHQLAIEYGFAYKDLQGVAGVRVKNLYDTYYENLPSRPMPGRNFNLFINFKI